MQYKNKIAALLVGVVAVTGLSATVVTQANAAPIDEVTICVKKNGVVYVVGDGFKKADCKKNDSLIVVNSGAQGPIGPQGPIGLTGPQGIQGDAGSQGPQGPVGPQGPTGSQLHL